MRARRTPWRRCVALLALAACAADAGPDDAEPVSRILLVTLDTTRADRIGAYGHSAARTPVIDALARGGLLFESAVSAAPTTLPSHASILTGVYPTAHGVRDNGLFALSPQATLLSEVFRSQGWRTGAFVGSYVLHARFGLDQGFEVYRGPGAGGSALLSAERPADQVVGDAIRWLGALAPDERFFAWVHLMDPHWPYAPPPPWRDGLEDAYDGEIAFCDFQLGRLLDRLRERGQDAGLLVVVTADHGESLGEHGEASHGVFVYQSALRVPLILKGPGVAPGARAPELVSNAGLAATLLSLAGLPAAEMPAVRLRPLATRDRGAASHPEPVYVESLLPYTHFRWHALRGLIWRGYKWIEGARPELYALASDPGELRNLAEQRPELAEKMRRRLAALLEEHAPLGWVEGHEVDDRERALLESLGYLAEPRGNDPFDPELPDPRDQLETEEQMTRVRALIQRSLQLERPPAPATAWQARERREARRRSLEKARELLLAMERSYPRNPQIASHRGYVELALGNPERAIELLERAVADNVTRELRSATTRQHLAMAYRDAGRLRDAAREMERALALDPDQPALITELEALRRALGAGEAPAPGDPSTERRSQMPEG